MEDFELSVREALQRTYDKIRDGEAPTEVIRFYQRMSPRDCSLWMHGFFMGISKDKILLESELFCFLKRQLF